MTAFKMIFGLYCFGLLSFAFFTLLPMTGAADSRHIPKVVILCYHKFSEGPPPDRYTVTRQTFQEQLEYLRKHNYRVLSLDLALEILAGKVPYPSGQPLVVITVDDGHESFYRLAYPLLKRYGYTATLYVPTQRINAGEACMKWQQLAQLQKEGYVIASHSLDHPRLFDKHKDSASPAYQQWLKKELGQSKEMIEKHLGVKVKHFGHPYGLYTRQVLDFLKELGYQSAATVNPGNNPLGADSFRLKRTMVFSEHTMQDFITILENNPLPLKTVSPADGAVVSGKDITLSAEIGADAPPMKKIQLFLLAHKEQTGFTFSQGVLRYKPAGGLPEGAYIIEIRAEDEKGNPWVGSWLFYVQERKGKSEP